MPEDISFAFTKDHGRKPFTAEMYDYETIALAMVGIQFEIKAALDAMEETGWTLLCKVYLGHDNVSCCKSDLVL